jgi:rhodanese-related sulfurtransferase
MWRSVLWSLAAVLLLAGPGAAQAPADRVSVEELKRMLAGGRAVLVLDVRSHAERVIKGARHVPLEQLEARLGELPRGREVVTYCA